MMHQSGTRFVHWPDIDITTSTHVGYAFQRHIHDSYTVGLVERGARTITTQDAETQIQPGEIYVLNPGQPHACQSRDANNSYCAISIKPETMYTLTQQVPQFSPVRVVDGQSAHCIRQLCALTERDHDPIERESILIQLLHRLITHYGDSSPEVSPLDVPWNTLQQVQDYIGAHYTHKLSLIQLAGICHLSPYHFQRTFVEHTGLSPHDYQLYLRIKHSKELLRQRLPIAEVAQDVGFVDQSHFTHSFKRLVGITPGYFAQQQSQGITHSNR